LHMLRRASQHVQKLGIAAEKQEDSMLVRASIILIEKYKGAYAELEGEQAYRDITDEIWKEEVQFAKTLENGLKEFEKMTAPIDAFKLFTTYGFPLEMTLELAKERGVQVDTDEFHREMLKHKELSRAGSEQKFKGGLADHSEKTTRLHTAHHLLLKALQTVLGPHVKQRGSNITADRLRIDFSHGEKMTKEQLADVERIVNERIQDALPVIRSTLPKEEAEMLGAEHEFGAKYPDVVSVYSIGPVGATQDDPRFTESYSIEFCGGPHVGNTREIGEGGVFRIQKEESVASGIRRIKAALM
jgi:alanyl-tRNA synthetase